MGALLASSILAGRTTSRCTRQGAEVWPISFVGGQSLKRALQVNGGVLRNLLWATVRRTLRG